MKEERNEFFLPSLPSYASLLPFKLAMTESSGAHSLEKRSPSEEEQDLPESLAEVEFSGVRAIEATASEITPVLKYFIFSGVSFCT